MNFDSVHGRWHQSMSVCSEGVSVAGQPIRLSHEQAISATDWSGCDLVIEASAPRWVRISLHTRRARRLFARVRTAAGAGGVGCACDLAQR